MKPMASTVGIAGAAQAGVHVEGTPTAGLQLHAFGAVHAEPTFRFDVAGYVDARLLGISLYEQRWALTSFEFGSNLGFGVRFPIHYVEGRPLEISTADVQFEAPDIDAPELLRGLPRRIA